MDNLEIIAGLCRVCTTLANTLRAAIEMEISRDEAVGILNDTAEKYGELTGDSLNE